MANKKAPVTRKTPTVTQAGASRRAELRAQQEAAAKRTRRNRLLIAVAVIVVVALVAGLLIWAINSNSNKNPSGASTPTGAQITPPGANSTDPGQMAWITVPSTNKKSTAIQVDIHTDYQCPWCKLTEDTYGQGLEDLANSGDIVLNQHTRIFLDNNTTFSALGRTSSERAAIAAACVDVADDTKYYAYNNVIFQNQASTEGDGFTDQQLTVDFPTAVGLSGDALQTFKNCYSGRQTQDWVENVENNNSNQVANNNAPFKYLYGSDQTIYLDSNNSMQVGTPPSGTPASGVSGTPTIFVNGNPLSLGYLFTQTSATAMPTPAIGTDSASILALLQQVASGS